jgi:hypothetical protein
MSDPDLNLHQFQNSDRCERTNLVFRPAGSDPWTIRRLSRRRPRDHTCTPAPCPETARSSAVTTSTGARSRIAVLLLHGAPELVVPPRPRVPALVGHAVHA